MSKRNTDKSDDNETESELRSEKNYKVECENNSMTSIIRESEEERMLRNIMKQREETIDRLETINLKVRAINGKKL